ncbi:tyrosine protein kinase [Enterococcus sp. BWT-B8]|uniref:YveK family protein n=1 Tax=unclassified Enterococcus TaxID=2608891 RepID=UPI001E40641F|nr:MULTISPECIES: Wzz/FepE/Etk N-terminal domain-containing protein [unclassified Enterococcus]MCB5951549.1 tyrosine protein kinase [Enterococcus sp. BWT-B8]MCB5954641.1 tyrosine protein kinase [Enterococcus sp. CWB-B31]
MEEIISLQDIFRILQKRLLLIIFCMVVGISAAGVLTFLVITPKYSSQAQLIVRLPQSEATNVNDINANLQMINTYKDLITSDTVINVVQQKIKEEYNQDVSISELKNSLSVKQSQNSQMFSISSTTDNPILSERIANQITAVFQETAHNTLSVDKISVISNASANTTPVSPNNKLNLVIGLVGGLMLGILFAFIMEFFDRTLKDEAFITEDLGLPLLGAVQNMTSKELNVRIARAAVNSDYQNAEYREFSENVQPSDNQPLRRKRKRV